VFATAAELRPGFVDNQGAPAVDRTVQGTNSIPRLPGIHHLDECKSPRLTSKDIIARSACRRRAQISPVSPEVSVMGIFHDLSLLPAPNVALRLADARRRARQLATENVVGQRKENKNDVARIERRAKKSHKG
jgi:hypothetical protein